MTRRNWTIIEILILSRIFLFNSMSTLILIIFSIFISNYSFSQEMKIKPVTTSGFIQFKNENDTRIYLESSYNNEVFYMMVDSYSWFSALPEEWVVDKWNFKKTPYIYTTRDFNNKRRKINLRLMDQISVSNTFSASNFYINPKRTLNKYRVGILGNDFLNDLNWKIDFKSSNLYFDTTSYNLSSLGIKRDFKRTEFPLLTIKIGNIEHKVIVDLGASQEISIPADSQLGKWLITTYNLSPESVKSGGANSENLIDERYNIALDSISIEGTLIQNVNIQISKNTKVSYIGCGLLKRGILYLNYRNQDKSYGEVGFEILE